MRAWNQKFIQYHQRVLELDPIAYWPLNEKQGAVAYDWAAENGVQNGVYTGVTLGQPGIGDGFTCPYFDGAADYVNAHSATFAGRFNGAEGSIVLWYKPHADSHNDGTLRRMIYTLVDGNNYVIIAKTGANSDIQIDYKAGGTAEQGSVLLAAVPTVFNCIGMTWSKTADQVIYYHAGVQVGAIDTVLGVWAGAIPNFMIGSTFGGANSYYGWLAHVAVFGSALSADSMLNLATV